jgi:hypothetical protein
MMSLFNTNALHNLLNAVLAAIGSGALVGFDWTMLGISEQQALQITGVLALLKIIINVVRDGPTGLVAPQPPVDK